MRIFNRAHIPWFLFVMAATVIAAWIYAGNFAPGRLPPGLRLPHSLTQTRSSHFHAGGTPVGLVFGSIAFAIFLFAALFGVRKKLLRLKIGSVQSWMRAHIWLTLLTIPLVLLHSGFRLGGPMTILLLVLYAIVMVSGIYGLILQHQIPRLMQARVPVETIFEQITHVREKLYTAAAGLRESFETPGSGKVLSAAVARMPDPLGLGETGKDDAPNPVGSTVATVVSEEKIPPTPDEESEFALIDFLDRQVLPYLRARRGRDMGLGNARFSDDTFRFVRLHTASPYRSLVDQIQGWCDDRRMLDLQTKLHHWLHTWLFVHVPVSFLLVILTAWHAFVTLFYY
jgi:hypothetical protein